MRDSMDLLIFNTLRTLIVEKPGITLSEIKKELYYVALLIDCAPRDVGREFSSRLQRLKQRGKVVSRRENGDWRWYPKEKHAMD